MNFDFDISRADFIKVNESDSFSEIEFTLKGRNLENISAKHFSNFLRKCVWRLLN